jgi:tetratricopeptide (TPR) repeat protein
VYRFAKYYPLALAAAAVLSGQAPPGKQYKDTAEFDAYNAVVKDMAVNNFAQAIADVDIWKQKYPETDYRAEREVLYLKACVSARRFPKALDEAGEVLGKGLEQVFKDPKDGPSQEIQFLYNATISVPMIADPTPAEIATGQAVARRLMNLERRPPGVSDADWATVRSGVQGPAKGALVYLAMLPGVRAMTAKPQDCPAAQVAFEKALEDYPDSSASAYNLGTAFTCQKKYALAIYEFARAAAVDPTLGGTQDANRIRSLVDDNYKKIHGSDEGLDRLKQQAKQSPMPPAGFEIKTAAEIAAEKEEEFSRSNPQLALWMKIKAALADSGGEQYFESQLKNSAVPPLKGTLVEAKPACRPKELLVAVPLPNAGPPQQAEILLKLDKPLTGKPETGTEFQWEGVPSAFSASPFLLTMDTATATLQGLQSAPCAVPVRKK